MSKIFFVHIKVIYNESYSKLQVLFIFSEVSGNQ